MSLSNITLNTKVYGPVGNIAGTAKWLDRTAGVPNAYSALHIVVKEPAAGVKNFRATAKLLVPVVQTDESACGCPGDFLRQAAYEVTMTSNVGSTTAERTDAYLRFKDLVASPEFIAAFRDLTPSY